MAFDGGTVLDKAKAVVTGDRQKQYGDPLTCLARIAKMWSVLLDREVTPIQVVQCMVALKQARLVNDPTDTDSWVDVAGYAALSDAVLGKTRA
jgi:hypothetical protein